MFVCVCVCVCVNVRTGLLGPLRDVWRDVAHVFAPLLHPRALSVCVRTALLLTGPQGSGRHTAVSAACAALGVNHIPWDCHEIKVRPLLS